MSRFFDLVSKPVRDMGGYAPALPTKPSVVEQLRLIGLDSNENPFGPSPRAVEAMLAALTSANSYPEDDCTELRRRLAAFHDIPAEQVLVTAGSTALLGLALPNVTGSGIKRSDERALIHRLLHGGACDGSTVDRDSDGRRRVRSRSDPTCDQRAHAARFPGESQQSDWNDAGRRDAGQVHRRSSRARGCRSRRSLLRVRFLLCGPQARWSIRARCNIYGKARPLWCCAHSQRPMDSPVCASDTVWGQRNYSPIARGMRNTFSVSSMAQVAALAAIDDQNHIKRVVLNNAGQAQMVGVALSELGYRVVPTSANFLYCDVGEDAGDRRAIAKRTSQRASVRRMGRSDMFAREHRAA